MIGLTPTIGVSCGLGSGDCGTKDGSEFVYRSGILDDVCRFVSRLRISDFNCASEEYLLYDLLCRLSKEVEVVASGNRPFCVIGGDHSIAMGTWAGAKRSLSEPERLGLIWIDAHCDAHTHETTHTGNVHGMPVAALLGYGKEIYSCIGQKEPIRPEDIVLIGVRDYEPEERQLLKSLGVDVYEMEEVSQRGFEEVFAQALSKIRGATNKYGLSVDMDGIDPFHAPGVGTPVPGGINPVALYKALSTCYQDSKLIGLEVVEFNPHLDSDGKTLGCLSSCIRSVFQRE